VSPRVLVVGGGHAGATLAALLQGVGRRAAGPGRTVGLRRSTGAGAVLNSLNCQPGSSLLVLGGGSVGLSALLAAALRELSTIVVVEPLEQRRELATALGATHAFDPADGALAEQVRAIIGSGVDYAVDATGVVGGLEQAMQSLAQRSALGIIVIPSDPAAALPVNLIQA
jgi:aryl-alcohol dehydrogenase